ncbi:MAG TPA: hypothetical protein VKB05_01165 [Pyrinomonadaceae bacterium]|nr:hypothetical protein [Pyrinomonadaceae bacterium]
MADPDNPAANYIVSTCKPGELSDEEIKVCISIIKDGGAVAVDLAKLRRAQLLAVARNGSEIVGVGSIKHVRTDYSSGIAAKVCLWFFRADAGAWLCGSLSPASTERLVSPTGGRKQTTLLLCA